MWQFVLGVIFVAVAIIVFLGLRIVQQSEVIIIERLGKYNRTLTSGVNIVWPVIEKPREITWRYVLEEVGGRKQIRFKQKTKIDLRETMYDFPKQNVITKDNVTIQINALLYFQIIDPVKAVYEIENLPEAIEKLTQTTLRNVIGELELDESLSSRDTINTRLRSILDDAANKWGVKVNRVELQDITPPADIMDAMEKQMRAERDRRAAVLEAEGKREAKVLEAEGIRESEIRRAQGERQSSILRAEGQAEAKVKAAQAEAEAIRLIADALGSVNDEPINYLIAIKYIEALQEMVGGEDTKTVYMPFEATGILSALGGIKEILSQKQAE